MRDTRETEETSQCREHRWVPGEQTVNRFCFDGRDGPQAPRGGCMWANSVDRLWCLNWRHRDRFEGKIPAGSFQTGPSSAQRSSCGTPNVGIIPTQSLPLCDVQQCTIHGNILFQSSAEKPQALGPAPITTNLLTRCCNACLPKHFFLAIPIHKSVEHWARRPVTSSPHPAHQRTISPSARL